MIGLLHEKKNNIPVDYTDNSENDVSSLTNEENGDKQRRCYVQSKVKVKRTKSATKAFGKFVIVSELLRTRTHQEMR